jgi:integrase
MASLHKDPRGKSPYWYCALTIYDEKRGCLRRAFRSTKLTDRKKAQDLCRGWEKAAEQARRGELTEAQARKVLDDILAGIGEGPIRIQSVREFFSNWLAGKKLAKKAATGARYSTAVSRFLGAIGERADKNLSALSPADVERFRDARTKEGVGQATVRLDLKLIRGVLFAARRQGLITHNPGEAVELPLVKAQGRDVFTPEEVRALLEEAEPDWKTAILLAYYTGQRLGDVVTLKWDQVDLVRGSILFVQGKTGSATEVPIHPELEAHLLSIAGDAPCGVLCPTLAPQKISGRSGLSLQFAKLMARAGIDQRQTQSSQARRFSALSFHSLRHSFASSLANAGVAPDLRMKLIGHKSAGVHARYSHHELEPLKRAIALLPSLSREGERESQGNL